MQGYWTLTDSAEAEITVKKSRFIATVIPVATPQELDEQMLRLRLRLPGARHYCHAAILRETVPSQPEPYRQILSWRRWERASDDGEPSGTAGKPILALLRGAELIDVVAVVTRYFGGILLGTGGLTHAYAEATRLALEQTERVRMEAVAVLEVHMEYSRYNTFMHRWLPWIVGPVESRFADEVVLKVRVRQEQAADFSQKLLDWGRIQPELLEEVYFPVE
jgi:uncharacterized YigZ family protein